jgi:hypothetical protein
MPAEDRTGQGNMWTSDQFTKYLEPMHGANAFRDKIQARMKQLVLYTLVGSQDIIDHRPKSFELFGCVSRIHHFSTPAKVDSHLFRHLAAAL